MKRAFFALLVTLSYGGFAHAQDAGQIQSVLEGAKQCIGCNLFQAPFGYKDLNDVDFENARLRQADLVAATLDGVNFNGANLSVANLAAIRAEDASFVGADLTDATLVGSWMGGADFTDAKLTGALLSGAYLETAKGLTTSNLANAYCDKATVFPKGLSLADCRQD